MDDFLSDAYCDEFRRWILLSKDDRFTMEEKDNKIIIRTKYCEGTVTFHEMHIIELSVLNTVTNDIDFYLHFQMKTIDHAIGLYQEMIQVIESLVHKPMTKVLLSCTSGLTTNYFAMKINEASEMLNFHCHCDAVPYSEIFKIANDYDMVFLAPQISYLLPKIQSVFQDKFIMAIPAKIFASYNVGEIIDIIRAQRFKKKTIEKPVLSLKKDLKHEGNILCLSLIRNSDRIHIAYRLYDEHNEIILDKEIIKYHLTLEDIYDVIDIVLLDHDNIKVIGFCTPGIINQHGISSINIEKGSLQVDIKEEFSKKYSQKICISNDVNTVAVGYYATQEEYNELSFIFQPLTHLAGVGNIVDGKLLTGSHNIAGELQYNPYMDRETIRKMHSDEKGAYEIAAKTIVTLTSILDPQAIIIACQMITDIEELKKEVSKYIPKEYIPDLIKVDYLQDYMLVGQLILCVQGE